MSTPTEQLHTDAPPAGVVELSIEDQLVNNFGFEAGEGPAVTPPPPSPEKTDAANAGTGPKKEATDEGDETDKGDKPADDATKKATEEGAEDKADTDAAKKTAPDKEAGKDEWVDKPELSEAQNAALRATPKDHRETVERAFGNKLEALIRDPEKAAKDVVDHMAGLSPSRFAALQTEIVARAVADPDKFVETIDDQTYGKLALRMVTSDPLWFAERLTGKKIKPADLAAAVSFHETHRDQDSAPLPVLSAEDAEGIEQDYPEVAEFLKATKLARADGLPEPVKTELQTLRQRVKELEGGDTSKKEDLKAGEEDKTKKAATEVAESPDAGKIFVDVRKDWESYVTSYAVDPSGLAMSVTDEERTKAPDVADLKEDYVETYLYGKGSTLPTFEDGVLEWGKDKPAFKAAVKQMQHFCRVGEKDNAIDAARALRPFFDAYRKERLKDPWFARQSARITKAAKDAGYAPSVEKHIPGGGGGTTQKAAAAKTQIQTDDDFVSGFGME